jgi:hypothetical protein
MKKIIGITLVILVVVLIVIAGVRIYEIAHQRGYAAGYEQCAYDTGAYIAFHQYNDSSGWPVQRFGMPAGLRHYIIKSGWRVGTPENMKIVENLYERKIGVE